MTRAVAMPCSICWTCWHTDFRDGAWISDRTTNYQISKNGANPSKHVRLREMFHKENYLSLEKVTPMDKFANHYKMVF